MDTVTLHIGPVKTGSTFIQDLLWRNRDDLARQGMQHPCSHENEMWLAANDVQDRAFIHFDFPECEGSWGVIANRVLAARKRSILSHEVLGFSTEEHIDRIVGDLAPRPLKVIVHARSLTSILPSTYQEKVKMADPDVSWDDWLTGQRESRASWSDTAAIVSRWGRHVPVEQIHVVTVPPSGSGPGMLLDRFADAAQIDTRSWGCDHVASNASLDADQTEVLRMVNKLTAPTMGIREQRSLLHQITSSLGSPQEKRKQLIGRKERDWIAPETDRRVASLKSSGARIHGDLTDLDCSDVCWTDDPPEVDRDRVAQLALEALVGVCGAGTSTVMPGSFI